MIKILLASAFQLFCVLLMATTISPFNDLGQLTHEADAIYLAKATQITTSTDGNTTTYYQQFEVVNTVKGNIQQTIPVKYHSITHYGEYRSVAGEMEFDEGKTYLLFLQKTPIGWITACVSYYIFEQKNVDDQELLVPIYQNGLLNIADKKNKKEPLFNYFKQQLIDELTAVAQSKKTWQPANAKAPDSYQRDHSKITKALPSHCLLSNVNPPVRWQDMETGPLKVYYESSMIGCTSITSRMTHVIDYMNSSYRGINLELSGSFDNYIPTCQGGVASGGNFKNFVDSNLNGQRSVAVMFDDPCNQIPTVTACSGGTLAVAGISFYTSLQHTYNGEIYSQPAYAWVVVNDNVGSCSCDEIRPGNTEESFTLIMAHELTHAIGFDHMNSSTGNMTQFCCSNSDISALDIQCVDHLYNPIPNQGCTDPTAENYDSTATGNDGSCTYCSNNIQDGNETGVDCGGTGPGCLPCAPDLIVQDCGSIIANATNLAVSGITIENIGNISIGASTVGYYLSTNTIINPTDYLIGTDHVSALGAGGISNESFSVTLSNLKVPNGSYYFGMIADYANIREEARDNNNRCYFPSPKITISTCDDGFMNGDETAIDCGGSCQSCEPDLVVDNCGTVSISSTTLTISNVVIKNVGKGTAPATRVGYYLSTNPTITDEDILVGTDFVSSLAPGASNTESISKNIANLNLPFGIYYVGMIADYNQLSQEQSEMNNTCYKTNPKLIISSCEDGIMSGDETGVDCGGTIWDFCDCEINKLFKDDINADLSLHAPSWIATSGSVVIAANADVNFIAQNSVSLNPGFEIKKGSKTVMNTQDCND